jgi:fibronectin-binding autotransporter adhesin
MISSRTIWVRAGMGAAALGFFASISAHAQTWNGGDDVWSSASGWDADISPDSADASVQVAAAPSMVSVDGDFTVGTLYIGSGNTVSVNPSQSLTVTSSAGAGAITNSGNLTVNSGQLSIDGTVELSGAGTLTLTGSTALVSGTNSSASLDNSENTIEGAGTISVSTFTNESSGTINANVSGQTLAIDSSGTFTDSGSLEAGDGATLQLSGTSSLNADVLSTNGSGVIVNTGTATLTNVFNFGTFSAGDNSSTTLDGFIFNFGSMSFAAAHSPATVLIGDGTFFGGGGTVTVSGSVTVSGTDAASSVDNLDNTIQGQAVIDVASFTNENAGTIDANVSAQTLLLASNQATNFGTMEATNGGTLQIGSSIDGSTEFFSNGGTLQALDGSIIELSSSNAILSGSTLLTTGSGTIVNSGTATLQNVINSGTFVSTGDTTLQDFFLNSGSLVTKGNSPLLSIDGNVMLVGGGTVTLGASTNLAASESGADLDNFDNTIQGQGTISVDNLTNEAAGTIRANVSGATLLLSSLQVTNSGTLEASNGATLQVGSSSTAFTSTNGTIEAQDNSTLQLAGSSTLKGGTLTANGTGTISNMGDTTLSGTSLSGSINNSGRLSSTDQFSLAGNVTLTGKGVVQLNDAQITSLPGDILTNVDNTIEGAGNLGGGTMGIVNQSAGIITANVSGQTLEVQTSDASLTNSGTLQATNGGTLAIMTDLSNQASGVISADTGATISISNGSVSNSGLVQLTGGTFDTQGGAFANTGQISGHGTISTGGLTNNGTVSFTNGVTMVNGSVTNNGTLTATNAILNFTGSFTNSGALISDPSTINFADLTIGAAGYIQAGAGNTLNISGNIYNNSTQTALFNIMNARLTLQGTGDHTFVWTDTGTTSGGNLMIGTLELTVGASLTFDLGAGNSIYITSLELDGGISQMDDITIVGGGSVFYDPTAAGNDYLADQNYTLPNGGTLMAGLPADAAAVPEPSIPVLLLVGVGILVLAQKRRVGPQSC